MINCKICEKELVSLKALSQHIRNHNITSEEYYCKYLKLIQDEGICLTCGEKTKFKNISTGYQKYCNLKCSNRNPDRKEKFRNSYLKNDFEKIILKRENTNLIKYGNKIANRNSIIKEKSRSRYLLEQAKNKIKYINEWNLEALTQNFEKENYNYIETFKCKLCDKIFEDTIFNLYQRMYKCTCQKPLTGSIHENQIKDFLIQQFPDEIFIFNEKIDKFEIDIFIPSKNIAIEYNGLYWHSEQILRNPTTYHLNKKNICNKKGIQLIQIFEDEWIEKMDIVKDRLIHILHGKINNKIHARKCIIKEVSHILKNEFLEKYHIQGKDNSKIKLGAFYDNELISIMTFATGNIAKGSKSKEGVWELNRFCIKNDLICSGIAGKLFTYFKQNYAWKEIYSYADQRWSEGNLYFKLGFKIDYITKPNYWYTKNGLKRIHRYKLKKREDEPKDIPEWILRQRQKYYRLWDCGNMKFSFIR